MNCSSCQHPHEGHHGNKWAALSDACSVKECWCGGYRHQGLVRRRHQSPRLMMRSRKNLQRQGLTSSEADYFAARWVGDNTNLFLRTIYLPSRVQDLVYASNPLFGAVKAPSSRGRAAI